MDGDELKDHLDEIICPYDLDWNNPFTDDMLHEIFKLIKEGSYFTMICDSCHSGTMLRELGNPTLKKARYLEPPIDIQLRSEGSIYGVKHFGRSETPPSQDHVLVSGCKDEQTSSDAYIDGSWQGAFTSSLYSALCNNHSVNWTTAHSELVKILKGKGFEQDPQLSGPSSLIVDRNVFGI